MMRRIASILVISLLCATSSSTLAQASGQASRNGEEVRFASDPGTTLAATLEKPHGSKGRLTPAAVIVAGTGPWTRGGFEKIRARLLNSGIAVLQYDKRGLGESTGTFVDTLPAMERDVTAAVAFLRKRRDIDPNRIALIGMSQGAVAAPAVASRDPDIAALVMLSGPVGPRGELFLGILRANLAAARKSREDIERTATAIGSWMNARSSDAPASELDRLHEAAVTAFGVLGFTRPQAEGAVAALDDPVVLSMYEAAPDRALAKVRAPVLAIYGSKDTIIAPTLSAPAATVALDGNPDALVVTVPGATHVLAPAVDTGTDSVMGGDHMASSAADLVGTWLAKRLEVRP